MDSVLQYEQHTRWQRSDTMANKNTRTLRGTIVGSGNLKRALLLDDGLINQGYLITDFIIWCGDRTISTCFGTLSSQAKIAGSPQDASINTEIAWAQYGFGDSLKMFNFRAIDPDHIINRDLFINLATGSGNLTWNYLILMEKRDLSDNEAILAIIREEAQNVGA